MKSSNFINVRKFVLCFVSLFYVIGFAGCESTPKASEVSKTSSKNETAVQKQKEAGDSPDVVFVKKLQAELNKGNIEGALKLFDSLPEELEGDKDLTVLEASLCLSAGKFDKAKKIAG